MRRVTGCEKRVSPLFPASPAQHCGAADATAGICLPGRGARRAAVGLFCSLQPPPCLDVLGWGGAAQSEVKGQGSGSVPEGGLATALHWGRPGSSGGAWSSRAAGALPGAAPPGRVDSGLKGSGRRYGWHSEGWPASASGGPLEWSDQAAGSWAGQPGRLLASWSRGDQVARRLSKESPPRPGAAGPPAEGL